MSTSPSTSPRARRAPRRRTSSAADDHDNSRDGPGSVSPGAYSCHVARAGARRDAGPLRWSADRPGLPGWSEVHSLETSDRLPPCSRCGGELLVSCIAPRNDAAGRPIHLQLCSPCDGEKPAAGALLFWFASGGGHDMGRGEEGARCLREWTKEAMAEHGWHWQGIDPDTATLASDLDHDEAAARDLKNPGTANGRPDLNPPRQQRDTPRGELPQAEPEQREQH
ncbi:DUF6300 family protein [Streptomyces sp. NPDC102279]|uniref:DUF6300 family protein n=1 Tax=Streptomyces sp. NPDC102279 TaxID=3366153 RepID=UPI0037F7CDF8